MAKTNVPVGVFPVLTMVLLGDPEEMVLPPPLATGGFFATGLPFVGAFLTGAFFADAFFFVAMELLASYCRLLIRDGFGEDIAKSNVPHAVAKSMR